jgi:hypothetical protein
MIVGAPFLARSLRDKWVFLRHAKEKPHFSQNRGEVGHPTCKSSIIKLQNYAITKFPIYSAFHPFTSTLGLAAPNSLAR